MEPLSDTSERRQVNTLREWRAKTARAEGVPPYILLTNRELVRVVLARPTSPTALGHVEGIGPGKIKRYGAAILQCLNGATPPAQPASNPPAAPAVPTSPAVVTSQAGP